CKPGCLRIKRVGHSHFLPRFEPKASLALFAWSDLFAGQRRFFGSRTPCHPSSRAASPGYHVGPMEEPPSEHRHLRRRAASEGNAPDSTREREGSFARQLSGRLERRVHFSGHISWAQRPCSAGDV